MKVRIEQKETTTGLLFKTTLYEVHTWVEFNETELAIIKKRKLEKTPLMERIPANAKKTDKPEWFTMTIGTLIARKPDKHVLATPLDAKAYHDELVKTLQTLKQFLEANETIGDSTEFEI